MAPEEFAGKFPVLYHLSTEGAWPSLQKHGLLCVEAIRLEHGPEDEQEQSRLAEYRPQSIQCGAFTLRDQKPLRPHNLARALEGSGLTNQDWLDLLNARVYFFPSQKQLTVLRSAYDSDRILVIEVSTRSLLEAHGAHVEVSRLNAGAVRMPTHKRDASLFQKLSSYEWTNAKAVAEVTVKGCVRDLVTHTIAAYEVGGNKPQRFLYERGR